MDELPLEITCSEVKAKLDAADGFFFLDCREQEEHQIAAIAAAELVPMSQIEGRLEDLRPRSGELVVVTCHHGMRSAQVAMWLRGHGFQAQSMAGGIDQWSTEIDPNVPRY